MMRFTTSLLLAATLASPAFAHRAPPPREHPNTDVTQTPFAQPPAPPAAPAAGAPAQPPAPPPHPDDGEAYESEDIIAPAVVRDRATVRKLLAAARAHNLAAFRAYRIAGVYPSNIDSDGELNVWRDEDDHFCAAATMIRASGEIALTERVADQNNNIKLGEVTQGPLMDWILTSGLTQDEVALIQRPFNPVASKPDPQLIAQIRIDARKRAAETVRLKKLYAGIERQLARQQARSLDTATDLLMKHPALIDQLVDREARYEAEATATASARKS